MKALRLKGLCLILVFRRNWSDELPVRQFNPQLEAMVVQSESARTIGSWHISGALFGVTIRP
jgi:hypothetical protein